MIVDIHIFTRQHEYVTLIMCTEFTDETKLAHGADLPELCLNKLDNYTLSCTR